MASKKDSDSLNRFREFLRIPSISGNGPIDGSYKAAVSLLSQWMAEVGLTNIRTIEYVPGKPVLIGSLIGTDPHAPSVLLNGHYDVVPVSDGWSVPSSFDPPTRSDGKIIARGTQDMKCVLAQYLESLRRLGQTWKPKRTVHVSFLPDEEVGGIDGAAKFVDSIEFKNLNVGFALDEGLANPKNAFHVFYGERASNWVIIRTRGPTGHGSRFIMNTAIEKMTRILNRIYMHRSEFHSKCHHTALGDLLSMNVTAMRAGVPSTALRGGFAINVIPSEAEIAIDIRVPLSVTDIESIIRNEWIKDETDVEVDFVDRNDHPDPNLLETPLEDDQWIKAISAGIKKTLPDVEISFDCFPAGTDGRFIRRAGIPCIGFSPIRNTPVLLHDIDEHISEHSFLEGIEVYMNVLREVVSK
jgi:aminoacylase